MRSVTRDILYWFLRAGKYDGFMQAFKCKRDRRCRIRHGICSVGDNKSVIHIFLFMDGFGKDGPKRGVDIRTVYIGEFDDGNIHKIFKLRN